MGVSLAWLPASKMAPSKQSPLTLYQRWSPWPIEFRRSDYTLLPRFAYKKDCGFHPGHPLSLLDHSLCGKVLCSVLRATLCRGPRRKELRSPDNSHTECAILEADSLAQASVQMSTALVDILTPWEPVSLNPPANLLPDSWSLETVWVKSMFVVLSGYVLG